MAFNNDGTDCVILDDDIFGDGDADAQALDVFICQRLRGNQYFLNTERRSISRSYYASTEPEDADSAYEGERPIGSILPSAPIVIPIKLNRGLSSATLRLLINVNDQNANGASIDYTLQVRDQNGTPLGSTTGAIANDASGYTIEEITCDLRRSWAGGQVIGDVVFRLQSRDAGDSGSNITVSDTNALRWTASSSGFIFNNDPGPAAGSPETLYLSQDDSGQTVDIFGVDDTATKTSSDIVFPDRQYINSTALTQAFSFRYMSYAQIRSVSLELTYDADRFGAVGIGALAAKQAVRGPVSIRQAEAINQYDRAPRMLSFGPGVYTDSRQQGSWATDYRLRWPISHGDGNANNLIDDTIMSIDESPRLQVLLYVIASVEVGGGVPAGSTLDEGTSDWVFDVSATQFDLSDSDWATPTSLGTAQVTRTVRTFPTDWRNFRFMRSKTILHDFSGTTGSHFAGTFSSNANAWEFACKEGQLFREDFGLITPLEIPVDLSLSYSDTLTPIRFELDATYDDGTIEGVELLGDVTAASVLDEALHLTLVGYSIYEV